MYYVYLIKSRSAQNLYIGYTNDLKRRLEEHNNGKSDCTAKFRPWVLVYYEAYASIKDAKNREEQLKHHGKVWAQFKKRLTDSINES